MRHRKQLAIQSTKTRTSINNLFQILLLQRIKFSYRKVEDMKKKKEEQQYEQKEGLQSKMKEDEEKKKLKMKKMDTQAF